MRKHALHPTIERYTLCGITHEGNENLPAEMAQERRDVNCPSCEVVIDFCVLFDSFDETSAQQKKVQR